MSQTAKQTNFERGLGPLARRIMFLCRAGTFLLLLGLAVFAKGVASIAFSPYKQFAPSLGAGITTLEAVVGCCMLPLVAYGAYFTILGRGGVQARIAIACVSITAIPLIGYAAYCFQQKLPGPGRYVDMHWVFEGLIVLCPQFCLMLGVALRCWMIRPAHLHSNHPMCGICGYDLTGNISGKCPECGVSFDLRLLEDGKIRKTEKGDSTFSA